MGAAREHGIVDVITEAGITMIADTTHQGGGPAIRAVQRRRRIDPDTGRHRRLSRNQKQVNRRTRPATAGRVSRSTPS